MGGLNASGTWVTGAARHHEQNPCTCKSQSWITLVALLPLSLCLSFSSCLSPSPACKSLIHVFNFTGVTGLLKDRHELWRTKFCKSIDGLGQVLKNLKIITLYHTQFHSQFLKKFQRNVSERPRRPRWISAITSPNGIGVKSCRMIWERVRSGVCHVFANHISDILLVSSWPPNKQAWIGAICGVVVRLMWTTGELSAPGDEGSKKSEPLLIVSNSQLLVSCDQYKHSVAVGAPEGVSAKTHLLRPRKLALLQHLKPLVTRRLTDRDFLSAPKISKIVSNTVKFQMSPVPSHHHRLAHAWGEILIASTGISSRGLRVEGAIAINLVVKLTEKPWISSWIHPSMNRSGYTYWSICHHTISTWPNCV